MANQHDAPSHIHIARTSQTGTVDEPDTAPEQASGALEQGTVLEPKGVYMDLSIRGSLPFVAIPGQVAGSGNQYIARRDYAHEHWNRLVEESARSPRPLADVLDRPTREGAS